MKLSMRPSLLIWSALLLCSSALPHGTSAEAQDRELSARDATSVLGSNILPQAATISATPSLATTTVTPSLADLLARKCSINGCAQCKEPRKRAADEIAALDKRTFAPVSTFEDIEDLDATEDISEPANASPGFIPFGNSDLSIKVIGLEGCSVIAAMSDRGMIAVHLFEDGATEGDNPKPKLTNTLHPNAFQDTLAAASRGLQTRAADLAGGQLLVLVPVNRDGPNQGQRRYATEPWAAVNSRKTQYTGGEVFGPPSPNSIDQQIITMAEQATGLTATVAEYQVSSILSQEQEDALNDGTTRGTFVMQYDPTHTTGPTPKARDMFVEGQSVFNGGISFA